MAVRFLCMTLLVWALAPPALTAGTITGTATLQKRHKHGDIVIFIESVADSAIAAPEEHAVVDQLGLVFVPFVLPIVKGTTVDFLNSDPVLHNVFSPDRVADKFNLGTWPQGQVRSHRFTQIGNSVILCNVHPEMEAHVVALPNPYYTVTAQDGSFTIPSEPNPGIERDQRAAPPPLPAGQYTIHAWHPKAKPYTGTVTVPDTGQVTVTIELARGKPRQIADIYAAKGN